jgi:hypothetical protein
MEFGFIALLAYALGAAHVLVVQRLSRKDQEFEDSDLI